MQTNIILSIVIPTKNRHDYLRYAIQNILKMPQQGIQLVIEDNSDTDLSEIWIKENIIDERLSYQHSKIPISMSENYDRAVTRATGEYICLLGDDDGINPEIFDAVCWAKKNNLDALLPINGIHYVWPDLKLPLAKKMAPGELRIMPFTGTITYPNPEDEILKCVRSAGLKFHNLPKTYYGIVKKECFEKVKEKTSTYFPGISPDLASALSVANFVKKMCQIDYPLFLPGTSLHSNAGLGGLGKHIGLLKDQTHLPKDCEKNWSSVVPAFYSVETIWAEAAVEALLALGRNDMVSKFNTPKLYADLMMWHPEFFSLTIKSFFRALRATQHNYLIGLLQFFNSFMYIVFLRFRSLLMRFQKNRITIKPEIILGIQNIDHAVLAFDDYRKAKNISFKKIIASYDLKENRWDTANV